MCKDCLCAFKYTNEIKKSISIKAADYLHEIAKDGDIIGVCWGTTIYNMALNLKHKALKACRLYN